MGLFDRFFGGAPKARRPRRAAHAKPVASSRESALREEREKKAAVFTRFHAHGRSYAAFVHAVQELISYYDSPTPVSDPNSPIFQQTGDAISIAETVCCLEDEFGIALEMSDDELVAISIRDLAGRCGIRMQ